SAASHAADAVSPPAGGNRFLFTLPPDSRPSALSARCWGCRRRPIVCPVCRCQYCAGTEGWVTEMRFAFALPLAFAGQALFASAVLADYDASQAWFLELPNAERAAAQAELILLGDYYYLVDGQFGTGTYN